MYYPAAETHCRKAVQIAVNSNGIFVVANDGSIWVYTPVAGWEKMPDLPQN